MRPLLVAASLLLLVSCDDKPAEVAKAADPPVYIEEPALLTIQETVTATAAIEAKRTANLRAEAPGRIVEVRVDAGAFVKAGDILVRLDVGRAALAVQAAQAQVQQANAAVTQAQRERELAVKLVAGGGAASRRADDAKDAERMAKAALAAAKAGSRGARRGFKDAVVRAPFDGTIVRRMAEVGEYVGPGTPIAMLADLSALKATTMLDPKAALDVAVGAKVNITTHAREDESFEGRVSRVSDIVDPRTRRLPVEVEVLDPQHRLRPGLVARFSVHTDAPRTALSVDESAIFERFGQRYVYTVTGESIAKRIVIEPGYSQDGRVEIRRGVSPSDRIIVGGIDRVVHDSGVKIIDRSTKLSPTSKRAE